MYDFRVRNPITFRCDITHLNSRTCNRNEKGDKTSNSRRTDIISINFRDESYRGPREVCERVCVCVCFSVVYVWPFDATLRGLFCAFRLLARNATNVYRCSQNYERAKKIDIASYYKSKGAWERYLCNNTWMLIYSFQQDKKLQLCSGIYSNVYCLYFMFFIKVVIKWYGY